MSILSNIPSNLLQTQPSVTSYTERVQQINSALSGDDLVKQKILEQVLPLNLFQSSNTNASLNEIQEKIDQKVNQYINSIPEVPSVPEIPSIVSLPKVTIPNPAEIRQFVNQQIEKIKRERQTALLVTQEILAKEEETPFTTRLIEVNNVPKIKHSCITTETGNSIESAKLRAETKLRRQYKCSGTSEIVNVTEENNVFIVTVRFI